MYPLDKITIPAGFKEDDLGDLPPLLKKQMTNRAKKVHNQIIKLDMYRETLQGYLACLSYADARMGIVLDALNNSKYRDNTIVVLWSDNGYHLGEKSFWAKHTLWDRTTNIPYIWAGPGIPKNKKYNGVVSLGDTFPTLVQMCNLRNSQEIDGKSLVPIFKNPQKIEDRIAITVNKRGNSFSVVSNKWRYSKYGNGEEELYDMQSDPHEWINLAENPECANVKKEMAAYIPANPAKPAVDRPELRLICEGESFKWVKNPEGTLTKPKKGKSRSRTSS
jgi:arylsulfatase A-like enzyme